MGFLIYKKTATGESIRYEKLKPLKLGGRDGLIARHVKSLTGAETECWKLDAASLLKLSGHDDTEGAVLFDGAGRDATNVCLYELTRIHGSCRDTATQLALNLWVLLDREGGADAARVGQEFEISAGATPRSLGETLALSGGPAGGDWKWGASALQIGATVVQASSLILRNSFRTAHPVPLPIRWGEGGRRPGEGFA